MMQTLEYGVFAQIVKMDGKSALSQVVKDLITRNRWKLFFYQPVNLLQNLTDKGMLAW